MISYLTILTIFVRSVRYKLPFARKSQNCEKKLQLPFLFFILWWEKKQLREVNLELREVKIRKLKLTVLTFWKKFTFCNSDFSKSQERKSELWDKKSQVFLSLFFYSVAKMAFHSCDVAKTHIDAIWFEISHDTFYFITFYFILGYVYMTTMY